MSTRRPSLDFPQAAAWHQQLEGLKQQALDWWNLRTPQERKLLRLGSIVIAIAMLWTLGLRPALNSIAQSREQLPRLYANAAQVDALILEARSLQGRQAGSVDATTLPEALRASLQRAGLEDSATLSEAMVKGSSTPQWEIALTNANAERVMQWLAGLPYLLQLQIQDVQLDRTNIDGRDRPGHVSGQILVLLPAKPAS